jgi:hypothetical protein
VYLFSKGGPLSPQTSLTTMNNKFKTALDARPSDPFLNVDTQLTHETLILASHKQQNIILLPGEQRLQLIGQVSFSFLNSISN